MITLALNGSLRPRNKGRGEIRSIKNKIKSMHADIKGSLEQINKSYRCFEHKGKKMSKAQVIKILKYALDKGYKSTADLTDNEVDNLLICST